MVLVVVVVVLLKGPNTVSVSLSLSVSRSLSQSLSLCTRVSECANTVLFPFSRRMPVSSAGAAQWYLCPLFFVSILLRHAKDNHTHCIHHTLHTREQEREREKKGERKPKKNAQPREQTRRCTFVCLSETDVFEWIMSLSTPMSRFLRRTTNLFSSVPPHHLSSLVWLAWPLVLACSVVPERDRERK